MIFRRYLTGATTVWISDEARREVDRLCTERLYLRDLAKLQHYAAAGLDKARQNGLLRKEGKGVFAFGGESRLRFVGFYDCFPGSFLLCDAFIKPGQSRGSINTNRVEKVAAIKETGLWRKE